MKLQGITNPQPGQYAILSHTWGEGEISNAMFKDPDRAKNMPGYAKIDMTCRLARARGLEYVWVDTCCIDQMSSADLSDALNSMFKWYRDSAVCFVFLADLNSTRADMDETQDPDSHNPVPGSPVILPRTPVCRWFTRGWTLQELIAPRTVEFYDSKWRLIGTKQSLLLELVDITRVDRAVLEDSSVLPIIPVGRRMSWAARRETTRVEDIAYSLLGIFDVNMPMLYGEGSKAFTRLQEEIIRETNDMSLFAWVEVDQPSRYRGLLAKSPAEFVSCRMIDNFNITSAPGSEYGVTNNGVKFETCLGSNDFRRYVMNLNCILTDPESPNDTKYVGIVLEKTPRGFVRIEPGRLYTTSSQQDWFGPKAPIYIRKMLTVTESANKTLSGSSLPISLALSLPLRLNLETINPRPASLWDDNELAFFTNDRKDFTGLITFTVGEKTRAKQFRISYSVKFAFICGTGPSNTNSNEVVYWAALFEANSEKSQLFRPNSVISKNVFDIIESAGQGDEETMLFALRRIVLNQTFSDIRAEGNVKTAILMPSMYCGQLHGSTVRGLWASTKGRSIFLGVERPGEAAMGQNEGRGKLKFTVSFD